jgi:hypothetical protein
MAKRTSLDSEEQRQGLTGKRLVRVLSDCLKWIGFRYGAPIYRAEANFTFADVQRALFPESPGYDQAKLSFTTKVGREEIRFHVTKIRGYAFTGDSDFLGDLFPAPHSVGEDDCFVVEGLLLVPDSDKAMPPDSYTFAVAEAYDNPGDLRGSADRTRVPSEPEDAYLKVIAVIACDREQGRVVSAVVQKLPSPADQILQIPPP